MSKADATRSSDIDVQPEQEPQRQSEPSKKRKKRRVRSASASSSSSTGYVATTRTVVAQQPKTRESSPIASSSPEIQHRLVKGKRRAPSQEETPSGLSDWNLSEAEEIGDIELPPALKPAEPPRSKGWQPRARPRALLSLTQLDGGSQYVQPDPGGLPPIVSDGTLTGTDSPRTTPRSPSRGSPGFGDVGCVSPVAAMYDDPFIDFPEEDYYLPPPLKPRTPPKASQSAAVLSPEPKQGLPAVQTGSRIAFAESAANDEENFGGIDGVLTAESSNAAPSRDAGGRSANSEADVTQSTSKESRFFAQSNKRKRKEREREETLGQLEDRVEAKTLAAQSPSARQREKGKKRRIIQSDEEEDEFTESRPICGHLVSLSCLHGAQIWAHNAVAVPNVSTI